MKEKIKTLTKTALLNVPYNLIKPPLPHTKNFTGEIEIPPQFVEKFLELMFEDISIEFERNGYSVIDTVNNNQILDIRETLDIIYNQSE